MSETTTSLQRQISSAGDLQSVVRTMKALAASSIVQYEESVRALSDYTRTVELGLGVCLRHSELQAVPSEKVAGIRSAVVFGSDQGLVGQFNDIVADNAIHTLATLPGKTRVWAVGERVHARLVEAGLMLAGLFPVPLSVKAITPLVGQILLSHEADSIELHLFYNQPGSGGAYAPISQRLLPLDDVWHQHQTAQAWPTGNLPQIIGTLSDTLGAFIREYLFVSIFRACAESLASENASRLAAMERADRNIDDLLKKLQDHSHRLRQSSIDEELFDVISGFEAQGASLPGSNLPT